VILLSRTFKPYQLHFLAFFLVLMCSSTLLGQGFTASVQGMVSDSSGAVLMHAPVTATNIDTAVKTSAFTDDKGSYTLLHLAPGNYRISVEMPGFKSEIVGPLKLEVDQRQEQNFTLVLGQVGETVDVGATVATEIQTETATVGGVVDLAQTSELPLNGRNFLELNLLVPGAAQPVKGSQLSTQGGSIEVHGQPENANYFWVDGLDNTTQTIGQYIINVPAYSIQEFRVMSPTYDSQFGRTPGANINVITRSGGNVYHGDAYAFLRNSVFDAKNYFDPAGKIPAFRRVQYGADLGGAIKKDKLFYYGAFEGLTYAQGETALNVVPSVQDTKGNFSDISTVIIDPTTGQPFEGNMIPQLRINATGAAIAALYPHPNQGSNTALVSPIGTDRDNVYVAKANWIISPKDRFDAYWSFEDVTFNQPIAQFATNTNIPGFGSTQLAAHDFTTGLTETHMFSPALLSVLQVGWNRYEFNYFPYARYQDWCGILNIQGCDEGPSNWNMPGVSLNSTYSSLGGAANQTEPGPFDTTFVDPTVTWVKGRHTLKFGYDFHHFFTDFGNGEGPRGTFTFNGKWTSGTYVDPVSGNTLTSSGNPLADLLLGLPYQATKTVIAIMPNNGHFLMDMYSNAGFIQDDFKVTPKFTLNLGLRYEYNLPATERRNYMANLDLSHGVANAAIQVAGQNGVPRKLYEADGKQFAPRVGFSYSPMNKTVIRGGFGVFYQLNLENTSQGLHYDTPFSNAYTIIGDGKTININDALVTGLVANVPAFTAMAKYYKAGMVMQYSLGFQRELPAGTLLDVSYVGNRGRDIDASEPINTPAPGPGTVQNRRTNINFAAISLYCPCVSSEYDGLEARLEKHFAHGSSVLLSYTWSRAFDDTGTPQDPRNISGQWGPSTFDIPEHLSLSYVYRLPVGRDGKFLNHMNSVGEAILGGWETNGIYQYHSGQPFTPILAYDETNTLENQDRPNLVGNPFASTSTCKTRTASCWMNIAAFAVPGVPTGTSCPIATCRTSFYTFGTAGKGEIRGPTFNELDFAISKNFAVGEGKKIEFRAEAFNILNHPNWDNPSATLSSSFGVIATAEASRQMQFGARFVF
jgi:hypothetical protein